LKEYNQGQMGLKHNPEGLRLQFKSLSTDSGTRTRVIENVKKQCFISEEVQSLLEKNAKEPVPKDQVGQGF
jgi:hypothetical protein